VGILCDAAILIDDEFCARRSFVYPLFDTQWVIFARFGDNCSRALLLFDDSDRGLDTSRICARSTREEYARERGKAISSVEPALELRWHGGDDE